MAILVYQLTCGASGKSYVGITARSLDTRWFEHCARARQGVRNSRLYDAMRKYGYEDFTRKIIGTADTEDEARSLEQAFIRDLDTFANGYNANEGGCGLLHVPQEMRDRIGNAQRGKVISQESRDRMSMAKRGRSKFAENFGPHTKKGAPNPRAASYRIIFPDGKEHVVSGIRAFCRESGAHMRHLKDRGHSKGYRLIEKLNTAVAEAANVKGS